MKWNKRPGEWSQLICLGGKCEERKGPQKNKKICCEIVTEQNEVE